MPVPDEAPVMHGCHPMGCEADADTEAETRIRRQRCPSDVIVVVSPFDPRRTPDAIRYPDPTVVVIVKPTAVVEHRPAKWFR